MLIDLALAGLTWCWENFSELLPEVSPVVPAFGYQNPARCKPSTHPTPARKEEERANTDLSQAHGQHDLSCLLLSPTPSLNCFAKPQNWMLMLWGLKQNPLGQKYIVTNADPRLYLRVKILYYCGQVEAIMMTSSLQEFHWGKYWNFVSLPANTNANKMPQDNCQTCIFMKPPGSGLRIKLKCDFQRSILPTWCSRGQNIHLKSCVRLLGK